jgi:two-component system, NtrC family, sensor kinase
MRQHDSPGCFSLNIRQKIILGLTLVLLIAGAFGWMAHRYLLEIERKQQLVEIADDLSNIILESRRYEKNYLLYGSVEDLQENRRYSRQGQDVLSRISPELRDLKGAQLLSRIEKELLAYGRIMEAISHGVEPGIEDQLREKGKSLVDLSQQLVSFERERILTIINTLKTQLFASFGIFIALGAFLIPIVSKKIIRPLRVIEDTTRRIGGGDFSTLPVLKTRDETQRMVEAFNRMVAELERRQEQLLQAKKLSSLGILTSGIAHQLNNPLNNISTSCQILLEEFEQASEEFCRKMLTNIEQEVHRARDIVRGLLEFSRVRDFSLVPTSLSKVVERAVILISSQVPPGVEIVREVPEDLVLQLDAQRMQEVFLNLLMNAVQAVENPPGQVRIRAEVDAAAGSVVISCEDTGMGIPQQDLGKIFDPFFSTKEVGAGTGLGLSIVYGIVQKHLGSIAVESTIGEGTRFIIRLPLHRAEESRGESIHDPGSNPCR